MSPLRKESLLFFPLFLLFLVALAACSSSNSQSSFDPESGKHPAGWLPSGHTTAAQAAIGTCTPCHGADYGGGISQVACADCHVLNGQSYHPSLSGQSGYFVHADYVTANGNSSCANALCHGTKLDGVGGTGPSCTSCHMGGINDIHPVAWGQYDYAYHGATVKQSGTAACANAACHGANLDGVGGNGPSCTACHMGGITSYHPLQWGGLAINHKTKAGYSDFNGCKNSTCHGAKLEGVYLSGHACSACHTTPP
jgi:hypothetical protein